MRKIPLLPPEHHALQSGQGALPTQQGEEGGRIRSGLLAQINEKERGEEGGQSSPSVSWL